MDDILGDLEGRTTAAAGLWQNGYDKGSFTAVWCHSAEQGYIKFVSLGHKAVRSV